MLDTETVWEEQMPGKTELGYSETSLFEGNMTIEHLERVKFETKIT